MFDTASPTAAVFLTGTAPDGNHGLSEGGREALGRPMHGSLPSFSGLPGGLQGVPLANTPLTGAERSSNPAHGTRVKSGVPQIT